jgi:ribosome biogenesis protein NSA1
MDKTKPKWQARNLSNDELDLQIPIWDTDICYLSNSNVCAVTAYGEVREYDLKHGQRRPITNVKLTEGMLLSKVVKSKTNDNVIFVITQEGHVIMADKRFSKLLYIVTNKPFI